MALRWGYASTDHTTIPRAGTPPGSLYLHILWAQPAGHARRDTDKDRRVPAGRWDTPEAAHTSMVARFVLYTRPLAECKATAGGAPPCSNGRQGERPRLPCALRCSRGCDRGWAYGQHCTRYGTALWGRTLPSSRRAGT